MKLPPNPALNVPSPGKTRNVSPEMRQAADGLESMFVGEMLKAMRNTVETSDLSMRNHASDIYQSMLDSEHAEQIAKSQNLGLSEQIIDYWLRMEDQTKYNESK